jgi:hypothetical protein
MKTRYIFLSTALTVVLTLPMLGHSTHGDTTKTDMKHHHMSKMMGKPTVDATVEGLHMKVWLMTQKHHKKMMKEMKHDGMEMDKATKEAMMAGTHCIMLDVTDATNGKEIANATAKVTIVSPSKMTSSFDLKSMMSHFGIGIPLKEKGEYQLSVSVTVDGVSKTKDFEYTVK